MTATTTLPDTTPSLLTTVGRAVAAEWTRLTTVGSTWWSMLGATAIMLFMGVVAGMDFAGEGEPVWLAAEFAIVPGQFPFLLVVLLATTSDYSSGAILSSLQWIPARGVLLFTRTVVPVVAMTFAAVIISGATDFVAWAIMGDAVVVVADVASSLTSIAVLVAAGGLLTAGLATVLRSTAGTLTATFMLLLVLPMMLPALEVPWLNTVAELLPGDATLSVLSAVDVAGASTAQVVATLTVWIGAGGAAGAWSLVRRDAT